MFIFTSVTKSYASMPAVRGISLQIQPGQTTALIGPSGCGKSTIFGLMTGLLEADAGDITFEGEPITPRRLPAIRQRIGYVIQDGGLFPHLNGRQNVTLMARHLRWPEGKIERRISELTTLVRLTPDLLLRYPAEMSGGQRQRVSLMRALMLDPDVLLLDEPLAALDPIVRLELQDDLAGVFERLQKTVVIVTHDIREAAFFAHQIVLIRAGEVVQRGTADELFSKPADEFVSQFVLAQQGRMPVGNSL